MKKTLSSNLFFLVFVLLFANGSPADEADPLADAFALPPASARPWVYWFWINGNVTSQKFMTNCRHFSIFLSVAPPFPGRCAVTERKG